MRTRVAPVVAVVAAIGCKELPEIPAGVCGNLVVEAAEDCDGFERDGIPCRPPGTTHECRLDCSSGPGGSSAPCPAGWGCFENSVCRPATGTFGESGVEIPGNAWSLLAGDFDGDGQSDLVSLERSFALGITKARVHYFGDLGELEGTYVSEKLMATPTVSSITRDSRSDLAYSFGTIFVLSGERDRTLLPETYPSYLLGSAPARALFVSEAPVDRGPGIAVFARLDALDGIFVFDPDSPFLRPIVELEDGVDALAANPGVGDVLVDDVEFPCNELVVAYRAASEFSIYSLCVADADGALRWREEPYVETVALDPPAPIEGGLVIADLDADGHLDIVVGTEAGPYAAYGNDQAFGRARPHSVTLVDGRTVLNTMPLAAADITGDGFADFVFPEGLAFSVMNAEIGEPRYETRPKFGAPWTEATFGDLNADGNLDIACGSSVGLDIDFFAGTGRMAVNGFTVSTDGPTEHLTIRDLDGDLVDDLVFVETRTSSNEGEQISLAFGRTSGGPEPTVPAAYLDDVHQIATFSPDPTAAISNTIVMFSQDDGRGGSQHAIGFLIGSSDRSLASPIELTTFSADGGVLTSTSAALTIGSFRTPGQLDVVAFALEPVEGGFETARSELWLIEDISNKTHGPANVGWNVDGRTKPLGGPSGPTELSVRLAAGDLDADGLDELVLVAPHEEAEQCLVNVAAIVGITPVSELRDVVELDALCFDSALELEDLDADGALDIAVLAGDRTGERALFVLWNDGQGGFSEDALDVISSEDGDIRAFTTLRSLEGETLVAYVTEHTVRLVRPLGPSRTFSDERAAEGLRGGTGIAAADLNGDGIVDLGVADSGSVRVFHAELTP